MKENSGVIAAVCNVHKLTPAIAYGFLSGIDKRPIDGPLVVERLGAMGDHQGDRKHHGGFFKAIYAFARETREALAQKEGKSFPDGFFGENLVTLGQDTDETLVGERWQVGSTILEATCPRTPCKTFAERMDDKYWPRRFLANGRCGTYFSVHTRGEIRAGDRIEVVRRPAHGVSIGDVFRGLTGDQAAALLDWAVQSQTVLYDSLARKALFALKQAGDHREFPDTLRSTGR